MGLIDECLDNCLGTAGCELLELCRDSSFCVLDIVLESPVYGITILESLLPGKLCPDNLTY
jgi:hypothetical protein